jgi:Uncharacterized protein conserved in bacteria (DUF2252)
MNIVKCTHRFEKWLWRHTALVEPDLHLKHQRMAEDVFMFFRATFYRWVCIWPKICSDLANAPEVLAVGDLHVENFGTWRDIEGRLIWGVNDFDEAWPMAYCNDLVRLAASAILAVRNKHLCIGAKLASQAILEGYLEALATGGQPFVLGEHNGWLRQIAEGELRDPVRFWKKMDELIPARGKIPKGAVAALECALPEKNIPFKIVSRVAGLGSLGHPRLVAIAEWRGGRIAREAKALVVSSCYWAAAGSSSPKILYETIVNRAVRCIDPFVRLQGGRWIVRRLSPHCSRIELETLPRVRDELKLLHSMGWETANIHLGTKRAIPDVRRHLKKQPAGWLQSAAEDMAAAVTKDWRTWKRSFPEA